jgi:hypothetical protein
MPVHGYRSLGPDKNRSGLAPAAALPSPPVTYE